jgi:flagellar motor switch protein FliG
MRHISSKITDAVLEDLYDTLIAADYAETGGVEFAQELIKRTLGPERANELINKITARVRSGPFDFLRDIDAAQIVSFLQAEHPQTIALVLAHLPPRQAAIVLTGLHPDVQADVAMRIALMDRTAPDVVKEVDRLLRQKISSVATQSYKSLGGVKYLVDLLNSADNSSSKTIVDWLDESHPELADEIKKNMFTFEDCVRLSDRDMQRVAREIDTRDLVLALRTANDELRQKFFKGYSQRAQTQLKEEMELQQPVRLSVVEDAQQKIVAVIRRLEQAEEITIAGGGGGADMLV